MRLELVDRASLAEIDSNTLASPPVAFADRDNGDSHHLALTTEPVLNTGDGEPRGYWHCGKGLHGMLLRPNHFKLSQISTTAVQLSAFGAGFQLLRGLYSLLQHG